MNNDDEAEKYYLKCLEIEPVSLLTINNLPNFIIIQISIEKMVQPILKKSLLKKENQIDVVEIIATCLYTLNFKKLS